MQWNGDYVGTLAQFRNDLVRQRVQRPLRGMSMEYQFGGRVRLALAGWYQGARAVRERGIFDDTNEFVRIVLAL